MELRIILFASLVVSAVSSPVPSKQYRSDYEYNKNTDAFYKLHTVGTSKFDASAKCKSEGAELVKITSDEDLKQVHAMMKKLSDLENYVMVVSNVDSYEPRPDFESFVVNRWGKIEPTTVSLQLPFVCKVAASDAPAPYNKECGVYSNDYESKMSTTGSCYRVSTVEATWDEAHANCQADGAHLVILSNDEELNVLFNMLKDKPHDSETQYFAGVRADTTTEPRMFKTVLNQTLEEVGYGPWDENEPNDYEGGENCVALDTRRHGKYNDVWCHVRMPYVCESSGVPLEISAIPSMPNSVSTVPVPSKQYRSDYEYNKNTDAFYKLHKEGARKKAASTKCKEEGAELAKIISDEDVKQIQAMIKKFPDLEDSAVMVSSDVNTYYSRKMNADYESNIVKSNGKVETEAISYEIPFVCKVAARDAPYNRECGVYSNGYESRISTTGSCYRVSTVKATWNEAQENCQAEGAHLVILSNDEELKILNIMMKDKPHNSETQYFAGVRAESTTERVFKTVLNQTLEEVGYGPWDENEPNDYEGGENCVALDTRRHGKYNDVWCHVKMPYVCERVSAVPVPSKQYRPDYEYNKNTDAFYKLHTKGTSKFYAPEKCTEEGAELVKITTDEDLKQVHAMMKKLSDLEDYVMVASDVNSDEYNPNYECKVVNRKGEIEKTNARQELPFVCKVAAKDAPYNKECGVYSNDYESRMSTTGSCYRVVTAETTWNEAHANCQAEGAHLVILSNNEELEVLYNMLKEKPHNSETQYFAGVRADTTTEPRVFRTVLNQTLEEVGYGPWDENEPNDYEGGENCVALDTRRHGKYNDVWCHVKMPYVCESSGDPLEISATPSTPDRVSAEMVSSKRYRPDYEYNKNTDSFYKLHTEGTSEMYASRKCKAEGAELVKITSDEDLKQIQAMMKKLSNLEDYVMVASDVHSDGLHISNTECNVVNRRGKTETTTSRQKLPFACKVAASDAPYDKECGVYSNDYESRISTTGSCYRVSTVEATWNEAHANCQAEGAHLVILSNDEELKVLNNIFKYKPHDSETQYFAGVRADTTIEPRVFKTVLNQTLEEVGYGPWDENEPNDFEGGENCVALDTRRHGKYNDVWCHVRMPYVCESSGAPLEISATPSTPIVPTASVSLKQYRPGYEYNKNTDAFYKLHTEGTSTFYASAKCEAEGAELLKITSDEDLKQVHAMMKKLSDLEDYVMVASDVNNQYSSSYEYNVVNRKGETERRTARQVLPFVCKVAAKDATYNAECGVYSNDYESKISTTGSCYRVSTVEATWNEAHANCLAEGAHLVILSNDEELKVLNNMLKDKPHNSETQYFAGVRVDTTSESRVFKTVLNQTLEEVGYGPWDENEPNDFEGGENCVALDTRRHGKYNDVWCHVRMPYVCESSGAPLEISATPSTPIVSAVSVSSKQYRADYEYNKNTDAFYKLHSEGTYKFYASAKCEAEGAKLVKITSDEDLKQVHAMMKKLSDLEDFVMVASDVNNQYSSSYECNVVNRKGETENITARQELPFVCKVAAKDATYNAECGVYSNDYESKISTTGSCYRVSTVEATWNEANANCLAEGAHLVILSNDEELIVLNNMLKDKPHNSETQYFAGVRVDTTSESRVFKTVLNQTLEEVGYGPWDENEPNDYEGGENCVALDTRRHGKYNDVWCHVRMPYVCESSGAPLEISATPSTPIVTAVPVPSKQYRPGYEYNKATDAFYKLHTEGTSKLYASAKCKEEGAELVKITTDEDVKQVLAMMKKLSDLQDYVMVASDVSAVPVSSKQYRPDYEYIKNTDVFDNLPTNLTIIGLFNFVDSGVYSWNSECNVVNRMGKTETTTSCQKLPFVCKVAARDALYDKECGVYSNDYESRISTTGSCYRVSTAEATWNEAHAHCQAEGAHLVILSNDEELEVLYNMLKDKPHDSETQYFAGVRADTTTEPRVFKTVLNQTLEEVGYGPWDENEPNDFKGGENCVALDTRRYGKYNDVWCHVRMPYVCESSRAPLEISTTPSAPKSVSAVPVPSKQYRPDYEYNTNTDAFYKLHTEATIKSLASRICIKEGAELVKITSEEDLKQVYAMMTKLSDLEDLVMIASDVIVDSPIYTGNVVNRRGKIERTTSRQELPFVCKVAAKDAPYNKECGVYSNDYESRISTTGSCYRVSTVEATWNEAHANCQAEGAHLVILSDDEELEVLNNMLQEKPHNPETQYFVGVRADTTTEPRIFKTVLNQTLEEVGYGPWEENEPNDYEGGENCVALDTRRHGKYNDVWCNVKMPYVCESVGVLLEFLPNHIPFEPFITFDNDIPNEESVPDPVSSPVQPKQYRSDYEYNVNADAFYKLHTEGTMKSYATAKCIEEGAALLRITSDEDLKQVHAMMDGFPNVKYPVFIQPKESSELVYSIYESNVLNHDGEIEVESAYQLLPFVCKVAAKDAPYNKECDVYSNDYESRISTTGSCYRVFTGKAEATWNEAHANCQAEGAHLVILNNDEELEALYNMLKDKPHDSETQYFAGVMADTTSKSSKSRVFKTVMNQTLEELGYEAWEENEPNDYEGGENCVALDTRRHGKYNDVWCHVRMPYVCERTLKTPIKQHTTTQPPFKSPDSGKTQSGLALSANIMQTLNFFFGPFSP